MFLNLMILFIASIAIGQDNCPVPTEPSGVTEPPGWIGCPCMGQEPKIYASISGDDEIARGSCIDLWVDSQDLACPWYQWNLSGTGFHFNSVDGPTSGVTSEEGEVIKLCADETACGTAEINVSDDCGVPSIAGVRAEEGYWKVIYQHQCGYFNGASCCGGKSYIEGGYRYTDSCVAGPPGFKWSGAEAYSCEPFPGNKDWATAGSGCVGVGTCGGSTKHGCYVTGYYPCFGFRGVYGKKIEQWTCP